MQLPFRTYLLGIDIIWETLQYQRLRKYLKYGASCFSGYRTTDGEKYMVETDEEWLIYRPLVFLLIVLLSRQRVTYHFSVPHSSQGKPTNFPELQISTHPG
jgi:hypothetical protein